MKSCITAGHPTPLATLIGSIDGSSKSTPHCKRKLSLKPCFRHRQEVCKHVVNRVNALDPVRPPSDGTSITQLHQSHAPLNLDIHHDGNEILVKKADAQDQCPSLVSCLEDDIDDLRLIGSDRDTPLSKLLDAFIQKIDSEVKIKAGQCNSSIDDDKELEISLCSVVDIDIFPLEDEDANFGLSFTDLVESHSISHTPDYKVRSRKVKFAPEKDIVIEIPSHRIFSEEEKLEIWNNSDAIRLQAFRNYAEWIWEGCDLANVVEEDGFCTDNDGNLLHPAHVVDENRPLVNTE